MTPERPPVAERVLGRVRGPRAGPTLVCVGGIHGNEPAGVIALRRVVPALAPRATRMAGELVALAGNLEALARGRRFVDRDLNRAWTPERVGALRAGVEPPGSGVEDREQSALLEALSAAVADARGGVTILDLHTTSGRGGCFSAVADTLENRALALHLPAPLVLGLEELVDGTLLEHAGLAGHRAVTFEAGQHDEPRAVERAEAAVWLTVAAVGLLPESALPELAPARKLLARDSRALPRVLEMRYRHALVEGDGYRMAPGYENFQRIERGEVLGRDARGEVRAPEGGRLLMPLYQEQGSDGFFVVREFRPFWLHVSRLLRRLGADRLVHWLPGVRRDPARPGALVVDRRVARWYALQLFHLLGFRRVREQGDELVVHRRPPSRG